MKVTNSLFLCLNNQEGKVPERIQLIPGGKNIAGVDGRKWTLHDAAELCRRMNAKGSAFPVDVNHSTDLAAPSGNPSPAVGWFKNLSVEKDGSVWADVEWNSRGQEALSNREYRFISPVFYSDGKKEITEILRAALTNTPNLSNPAINSQMPDEPAKENTMDKELCAALGLPETATKEDVLAAISAQKAQLSAAQLNSAQTKTVDLAAYCPRADLNAMQERAVTAEKKIAELNAAALKGKAEKAVDDAVASRKIAPASREEYLNLCSTEAGLASFNAIMAKTPSIIPETGVPAGNPPDGKNEVELNAAERSVKDAMGYTDKEWSEITKAGK